jgi:hypothetical protein
VFVFYYPSLLWGANDVPFPFYSWRILQPAKWAPRKVTAVCIVHGFVLLSKTNLIASTPCQHLCWKLVSLAVIRGSRFRRAYTSTSLHQACTCLLLSCA